MPVVIVIGAPLLLLVNFLRQPTGDTLLPFALVTILGGLFLLLLRWYKRAIEQRLR